MLISMMLQGCTAVAASGAVHRIVHRMPKTTVIFLPQTAFRLRDIWRTILNWLQHCISAVLDWKGSKDESCSARWDVRTVGMDFTWFGHRT
jgi:hypothetical protein